MKHLLPADQTPGTIASPATKGVSRIIEVIKLQSGVGKPPPFVRLKTSVLINASSAAANRRTPRKPGRGPEENTSPGPNSSPEAVCSSTLHEAFLVSHSSRHCAQRCAGPFLANNRIVFIEIHRPFDDHIDSVHKNRNCRHTNHRVNHRRNHAKTSQSRHRSGTNRISRKNKKSFNIFDSNRSPHQSNTVSEWMRPGAIRNR